MIRRARQTDFSRVCEIYAIARAFMAKTGNATQWGDSFPPEDRVAGSGEVRGLFGQMVDYAWGVIPHLRIDTHENNAVMRHLVAKHGFQRCGVIYTDDGTPRIAFERI